MLESTESFAANSTCMGSSGLGAIPVHVCQRIAAAPAALLIARAQLGADTFLQPLWTATYISLQHNISPVAFKVSLLVNDACTLLQFIAQLRSEYFSTPACSSYHSDCRHSQYCGL